MDCLFSKYGSPFIFLDGVIQTARLSEFVDEFLQIRNEEKTWEFFLHKVFDKSFQDFMDSINNRTDELTEEQLETTIHDSKSVLLNFIPKE